MPSRRKTVVLPARPPPTLTAPHSRISNGASMSRTGRGTSGSAQASRAACPSGVARITRPALVRHATAKVAKIRAGRSAVSIIQPDASERERTRNQTALLQTTPNLTLEQRDFDRRVEASNRVVMTLEATARVCIVVQRRNASPRSRNSRNFFVSGSGASAESRIASSQASRSSGVSSCQSSCGTDRPHQVRRTTSKCNLCPDRTRARAAR